MEMRVLTSKKLSIKIGEYSRYYVTSLVVLERLKIAWKEYQAAKKEVASLCKTLIEEKIAWKAQDCNVSLENIVKMMIRKERSIQ